MAKQREILVCPTKFLTNRIVSVRFLILSALHSIHQTKKITATNLLTGWLSKQTIQQKLAVKRTNLLFFTVQKGWQEYAKMFRNKWQRSYRSHYTNAALKNPY